VKLLFLLTSTMMWADPTFNVLMEKVPLYPGDQGTLKVLMTGQSSPTIVAFQAAVTGTGIEMQPAIASGTAASAGKTAQCGGPKGTCLVFGLNQNPISDGEVLSIQWRVPEGSAGSTISVNIAEVLGVGADGKEVKMGLSAVQISIKVEVRPRRR